MPRARRRCSHRDCDELMPCPEHRPVDQRGTTTERGYGQVHRRRAAALRAASAAAGARCSLCQEPIDYRLKASHPRSFVAHHVTVDKLGPLAPAHKVCNERAGQPVPTT